MTTTVIMPKLGMDLSDGRLVEWLKEDGAPVREGEPVAVVETDKISIEIEAGASGILRHAARPGEVYPIGGVIGHILGAGEEEPSVVASGAGPAALAALGPGRATGREGQVPVSPAARKLAAELGVDLSQVCAEGPRISLEDVRRFHDRASAGKGLGQETGSSVAAPPGPPAVPPEGKAVPLSAKRQVIAERLVQSLQTMAQLTLTRTVDATALVQLLGTLRRQVQADLSYTDLLVRAAALALRRYPLLNSRLVGNQILFQEEINIGVAVALEDGLIVPVIRQADTLDLQQIHGVLSDLAGRARAGTLIPVDVSGGTFTITNLGMYGVEAFSPIINPPEVAILGVGRITPAWTAAEGQVVERRAMVLSLSIDHRVVDGAPGALFLQELTTLLEAPDQLT